MCSLELEGRAHNLMRHMVPLNHDEKEWLLVLEKIRKVWGALSLDQEIGSCE